MATERNPDGDRNQDDEGPASATSNADSDWSGDTPSTDATEPQTEREAELATQLTLLETENERLRREYRRATRATYRRSALALFALGVLSLVGAALFPAARTVLLALGGVGCFGGILTYYLTPERVLTASVAQHLAETMRTNTRRLVDELGLQETALFLPDDTGAVWLFLPQHPEYELPDAPDRLFVVAENAREQGVALVPVGEGLFEEFERGLAGPYAEHLDDAADQLAEAIVEQFELAGAVTADPAASQDRVVFGVSDPAIAPLSDVEQPIPSFLGTALARHRDGPVRVTVREGDDRYDTTILVEWGEKDAKSGGHDTERDETRP